MPSHSAALLEVFPTPGTSPNESPSDHAVQCSADSDVHLQNTDEMAQPTETPETAHNEPIEAPKEEGNQEEVKEVEEGEEAQEGVQKVKEEGAQEKVQQVAEEERVLDGVQQVEEEEGAQEGVQQVVEEGEEVYRWTLPAIFPNGKPLRIKESEEHCLEVFLLIILQIYKKCFHKLSRDKTRFGQNLTKLDPETAQEIFDDLENEVERYKERNPKTPLMNTKDFRDPKCTPKLAEKIVEYAYQMAIPRPEVLNKHYKGFTSEVYGETNIPQFASVLDELNVTEDDVFVDLGSGVGSLVTYAATRKLKKAIGIEKEQVPAEFAKVHAEMFDRLMDHFGKEKGSYNHHHDSFLSEKFRELITKEATIIYMNNFAFKDEFMQKIIDERLQYVEDGVRIVTTKTLGTRRTGTIRNKDSHFSSFCEHKTMESKYDGVSWTSEKVPFCKATVNKKQYEIDFFERKEKEKEREEACKRRQQERLEAAQKRQQQVENNEIVLSETNAVAGQKRKNGSRKGGNRCSKKARK